MLAAVAGLLAVALAIVGLGAAFRNPEGHLLSTALLPLGGAIGLAVAASLARMLRSGAWWLGLALAGFAATLQLIDAGTGVRYQHFAPWPDLASRPAALLVALQAVLVALAIAPRAARIIGRLARAIGPVRLTLVAVGVVLLGATLTEPVSRYAQDLVTAALVHAIAIGNIALVVIHTPEPVRARLGVAAASWWGGFDDTAGEPDPRATRRLALGLGIAVVIVAALLNVFVYERHPHVPDEHHYLFQARYFAAGRLALPLPPVPRAFDVYLTGFDPGWYSVVPPGWPLVLAAGALVGLTWLVNPLLAGLNVVLAGRVLGTLYRPGTARLALCLLAASPWYLFLAMSYMPHMAVLAAALLATLGVMRARATGQARWAWLAGTALGLLALNRQLDAMIVAVGLGLWAIGLGGRRLGFGAIAGLVLGSMLAAAPILAYNRHFTGSPTEFPIMRYNDERYGPGANDWGFGPDRGMGWALDPRPGHDTLDGLVNTNLNATALEVELFGWPTGSLLLVLLFAVRGRWRTSDRLMLGMIGITWVFYFLNYFSGGPDFGPRYWFPMFVPLVALAARGVETLAGAARDAWPSGSGDAVRGGVLLGAGALSAAALLVFVPWRSLDKYRHFRGMRSDVRALADSAGFGRSLVLVNGREVPDYLSAATYNPIDLDAAAPIYAWNRDSAAAGELRRAFPDRPVWILDGPTRTGGPFRIRAGPVAPGAPLPAEANEGY